MASLRTSALTPLTQFLGAIRAWFGAFGYMRHQGLSAYHLAGPVAIAAISLAGVGLTGMLSERIRETLLVGLDAIGLNPDDLGASPDAWWTDAYLWGASQLDWMLEWGVALLVLWIKVKLTKYLLLTLMAPVMSALAGAVRKREVGSAPPFSAGQLLRDVLRGVRTSSVLLLAELGLSLALALSGLLLTVFAAPLAILLSPALLVGSWMVGAYFYGAAVFDAVYEQDGLDWRTSIRRGWSERARLLGIGAVFSALLAVPFVGVLLAAFLGPMPCTTAAARLTHSAS